MIEIRLLKKNNLLITRSLAIKIWPSAYGTILSKEQLDYMLDWMYSKEKLEKDFDQGNEFYCAYANKKAVAYIELEFSEKELHRVKLQKIYVLPNEQKKGIGLKLLEFAQQRAKIRGAKKISLQVNRANKAVDFYLKNNFSIVAKEDFPIGNGYFMNDFVMEKTLT